MGLLHKARCGWGWATKSGVREAESSRMCVTRANSEQGLGALFCKGHTMNTSGFAGHTASAASPQFHHSAAPLRHMAFY